MRKIVILLVIALLSLLMFVSAQVVSSDPNFFGSRSGTASFVNYGSGFSSYYGNEASTYWPVLANRDECTASQDILVQISPAGCQPTVVRSDLLAEQNVPVFCQLDLLQVNPAIDIKQIRNIRFNGQYPSYVAGVGFHPANAALRTTSSLLGTPLETNVGYVVVVLKKNPDESTMPDFLNFTLGASIDYYSGNAVGIGATELLLRETNNEEWEVAKNRQTLFNGKMSVRVRDTEGNDSIKVEIYSGDIKYSELTLQKNKPQSNSVYLPGSYCQTALQFNYDSFVPPSTIARIQVDDDILDLYQGSRFLNGKCSVRSISEKSVDLSCGRETVSLTTTPTAFALNDKVYLVKSDFSADTTREYTISKVIKENSVTSYNLEGQGEQKYRSDQLRPTTNNLLYEATYGEFEPYIANATSYYESLANDYGNLRKQEQLGEEYGEVALSAAIDLAIKYDKKVTASRLINKYLDTYPNGKNRDKFTRSLNDLYIRDTSLGTKNIESDDGYHLIKLLDITPSQKKSSAKISWGTQDLPINQGETVEYNNVGKLTLLRVKDSETVELGAVCNSRNGNSNFNQTVRLNSQNVVSPCGVALRVNNIEFLDYVKLRITPVTRSGTITNFTVGIGIEKRAIELTPNKAAKKIENLNASIKKWEGISKNLGDLVTGLKSACFATAGVLTVKNFFTGMNGEALARRNAMGGEDGWTKFCQSQVNAGTYQSLTQCYNANSLNIGKDVNARVSAITKTNDLTKEIEARAKYQNTEGVLAGQNFNDKQAKQELINKINDECSTTSLGPKSIGATTSYQTVGSLFPTGYNVDSYSYTQLRDIYYNCQTIKNGGSERGNLAATAELDNIGYSISERLKYDSNLKSLQSASTSTGLANAPAFVTGDAKSINGQYYGGKLKEGDFGLNGYAGKPAQLVYYNSNPYIAILKEEAGGTLVADKVYPLTQTGSTFTASTQQEAQTVKEKLAKFEVRDSKSYNNKFAPGESTVRYFETEPYKGLPAVVPFDLNRGFYAAMTQALPIFGGTKSYEENGRPSTFFVCNVMKDSNIGFYAPNYGDDECVQFNIYTGQSFSSFPGLTEQETKKLVTDATNAIREASQQYGKSTVKIGSNTLNVGRAASLLPGSQCQDYMSPEECKLLFNVCDPVICPASRCNFGGQYYVSDVIQSGVVGSALLCLPNVKEEIVVPVCLTGIKAGIDGYVSILKSHQQCLQEAIDTGKYVGICDQVSSVYMCEFFWRQAAPLAKNLLPKLVEGAYTGGQNNVRGGGEYMTVQSSWQNAQDSVNYFTQSYAVNSFDAFKVRSIEEAGTEVCRAFVSAKAPKTFETLVEPESPPQFHAWYSSIDYTDATIPATSQYKVFYHIFAGEERGVSYSVYLRDPPLSSQYASPPSIVVSTGFVARGQYATESKDFTAPKGYQQLCVRINDKEECGFKQVSSSFAVNYVRDSIVSDELSQTDISSEQECVSGSVNPSALLNPNLGSAAQEVLDPAIYNRGIVRVCATDNPGSKTEPSRYVNVGNCGNERMLCWLDKNSLDRAITDTNVGLKNQTLSEIEQIQKGQFNNQQQYVGSSEFDTELNSIKPDVDTVTKDNIGNVIGKLNNLDQKASFDFYKAELLFWKAKVFEKAFINSIEKIKVETTAPSTPTETPISTETNTNTEDKAGEKVLRFDKDYSERTEVQILLDGQPTGVYLQGSSVKYGPNRNIIGSVTRGKITFLSGSEEIIDTEFGPGMYQFLNTRLFVTNIEGKCDLDTLHAISTTLPSCIKIPGCTTQAECATQNGGNEKDYECFEEMCYPAGFIKN